MNLINIILASMIFVISLNSPNHIYLQTYMDYVTNLIVDSMQNYDVIKYLTLLVYDFHQLDMCYDCFDLPNSSYFFFN
jgi:hypothetical protein